MSRHDYVAPKPEIVFVESSDALALVGSQERLQHGPPVAVEMRRSAHPVGRRDTRVDVDRACRLSLEYSAHLTSSESIIALAQAQARQPRAPLRQSRSAGRR